MKKLLSLLLCLTFLLMALIGCQKGEGEVSSPSSSSSSVPVPGLGPLEIPEIADFVQFGEYGILNITPPTYGYDNPGIEYAQYFKYPIEYFDETIPATRSFELNGKTLTLTYEHSNYYLLIDRHTLVYKIEGELTTTGRQAKLQLYADGTLFRIHGYQLGTIPGFDEMTDEEKRESLEELLDGIVDFSAFTGFRFSETEHYVWQREINGHEVFDWVTASVDNEVVSTLCILPPSEVPETLMVSEEKLDESITAHLEAYYTSKEKRLFSYEIAYTSLIRYNGENCIIVELFAENGAADAAEADKSTYHYLLISLNDGIIEPE